MRLEIKSEDGVVPLCTVKDLDNVESDLLLYAITIAGKAGPDYFDAKVTMTDNHGVETTFKGLITRLDVLVEEEDRG